MTRPILSARAVSCQRDALAPRRAHPRLPGPGWGRDDLAVVWLDAHGDFNTPAITISGYLGGMALAMLTGLAPGLCRDGLGLRPVADADIVLADARDLDPAERDALAASHVRRVPADPVAITSALSALGPAQVYLHLDVDVIDSAELPGLRFPSGPGPSVTQIEECLAAVGSAREVTPVPGPGRTPATAPAPRSRGAGAERRDLPGRPRTGCPRPSAPPGPGTGPGPCR
jgi:hypothetical protein